MAWGTRGSYTYMDSYGETHQKMRLKTMLWEWTSVETKEAETVWGASLINQVNPTRYISVTKLCRVVCYACIWRVPMPAKWMAELTVRELPSKTCAGPPKKELRFLWWHWTDSLPAGMKFQGSCNAMVKSRPLPWERLVCPWFPKRRGSVLFSHGRLTRLTINFIFQHINGLSHHVLCHFISTTSQV